VAETANADRLLDSCAAIHPGKRLAETSDIAMTKALQSGEFFKPMIRPELAIGGGD
jgi:hypothetical protein